MENPTGVGARDAYSYTFKNARKENNCAMFCQSLKTFPLCFVSNGKTDVNDFT